jgi:hypothetical protein
MDYRGAFWILRDASAPELPMVKGNYRVVVPAGRVLRVRSFVPFERWHGVSARFEDGSPLPQEDGGTQVTPQTVALRDGRSVSTMKDGAYVYWLQYFVGTQNEYGQFVTKGPASQVPPDLRD